MPWGRQTKGKQGELSGCWSVSGRDPQPSLVKLYQEKARGLDRMDQNIAKYKVKIRSMKWYVSFISYIIDAALNNACQLHRVCSQDV
ncbi:hypothetical protein A6R68_10697 [Neotoma lepida]|uniref:PiggyBac transposable element-derived protein domain-containing protein n=1 Tax=Neotoma lepida TaxID=56216 RepID=A0A1A6FYE7_NEOLE|nr:hypothetical protein A6R68_10697 [Neotoma lepida]